MKTRTDRIEAHLRTHDLYCPLDALIVGATGSGKSSTLNALFGNHVAEVGNGVDPQTQHVSSYKLTDYLRFHDSAGLGDGREADLKHARNITEILLRKIPRDDMDKPYAYIDLVFVILDGSHRDLGTTFSLLQNVVLKSIEPERVAVAINQADLAMKGHHWDENRSQPEPRLIDFLEEKADSVKARLYEATGLKIKKPVYYSACHRYNLNRLLDHLIKHLPTNRRILGRVTG